MKRHRWEDSRSDETGHKSDPTNETIRARAEDAEYKSGSDTKKGERLLLRTCFVKMAFPTGVVEIRKCSDEALKTMLDEAREAPEHSRKLGRVMGIVADHRSSK